MDEREPALSAAIAGLERALDPFAPPLTLPEEALEEVSLTEPPPPERAAAFAGVEAALEQPLAALRAAIGDL